MNSDWLSMFFLIYQLENHSESDSNDIVPLYDVIIVGVDFRPLIQLL